MKAQFSMLCLPGDWDARQSQVARLVQGGPLLPIHSEQQSEDVYSLGSGERWA